MDDGSVEELLFKSSKVIEQNNYALQLKWQLLYIHNLHTTPRARNTSPYQFSQGYASASYTPWIGPNHVQLNEKDTQ